MSQPRSEARTQPILLGTWSFSRRCLAAAWPALAAGGSGLDAVELACREAEADPRIDSVGYGGLPDADGAMSLDGCVMLGPRRSGAVCALRHCRHPVSVARRVMETTEHLLLAGDGADRFAAAEGFPADELLAPEAAEAWARWVRSGRTEHPTQDVDSSLLRPIDDGAAGDDSGRLFGAPAEEHGADEARWRHHDTIGVLALDAAGVVSGACSTSGTPFKRRGRVGDSPIIGHALYVDPEIGAAVATGSGELVMGVCGAFLAIEELRRGESCLSAIRTVLERIASGGELKPRDQVGMIVLRADGEWASAALRSGFRCAIACHDRIESVDPHDVLASP